jgi:hypothetical protein
MWNDTELQHDIENEVGWELSAGLTQISVTVKSGAVELGGHSQCPALHMEEAGLCEDMNMAK